MRRKYDYKAFVSYSSEDVEWVREFVNRLTMVGIKTCYDQNEFRPGYNFMNEIHSYIQKSEKLILIITPQSVKSKWINAEISAKLRDDPNGDQGSIIPILFKNATKNDIPESIRHLHFLDLTDHPLREIEWKKLLVALKAKARLFPKMPYKKDAQVQENFTVHNSETPLSPVNYSEFPRNIAIIGMGYLGLSLAALLANAGHTVIGVEANPTKVSRINVGLSHLLEPGIDELVHKAHLSKKLRATHELKEIGEVDFIVVCLGPNKFDEGKKSVWETSLFKKVLEEIGEKLKDRKSDIPLNVIIAATVRPQDCEQKTLEAYFNRSHGNNFFGSYEPYFSVEKAQCSLTFRLLLLSLSAHLTENIILRLGNGQKFCLI